MNNLPLHPIVVHLPLVMAFVVPILVLVIFAGRRRNTLQLRSWWVAVLAAGLLAAGSTTALKTGEHDEELVEDVVADTPMETHEEAGEAFMWGTFVLLALMLPLPFLRTARLERMAIAVAMVGGITVGGLAIRVGHSGGLLVYEHGAATAFAGTAGRAPAADLNSRRGDRDGDDDDRERH